MPNVHNAAADGLLKLVKEIAAEERSEIFKADHNGWRRKFCRFTREITNTGVSQKSSFSFLALHEAARGGHYQVVEYLLNEGAQINERTNDGLGGNALWWAEKGSTSRHKKTVALLKKHGAITLGPKKKNGK